MKTFFVRAALTLAQVRHEHQAMTTPAQRASISRGMPPVAATRRPSEFAAPGVERARAEPGLRNRPSSPSLRTPQQEQRQDGPRR